MNASEAYEGPETEGTYVEDARKHSVGPSSPGAEYARRQSVGVSATGAEYARMRQAYERQHAMR